MIKFDLTLNGRKVTSASQIERELRRAVDHSIEDALRQAAGSRVRITKRPGGYQLEGPREDIERLRAGLG